MYRRYLIDTFGAPPERPLPTDHVREVGDIRDKDGKPQLIGWNIDPVERPGARAWLDADAPEWVAGIHIVELYDIACAAGRHVPDGFDQPGEIVGPDGPVAYRGTTTLSITE